MDADDNDRRHSGNTERLAIGLGLFSIGLGLAELLAPRAVARLTGMPDDDDRARVLRTFGAREIGAGVAILAQPDRARWLWSRVGGDAVDLSYLGAALRDENADGGRIATALAAVAGVTALDVVAAQRMSRQGPTPSSGGFKVEEVVTIGKPPEELYGFWRNFINLPRFMKHLDSVELMDDRRSRWRARAPGGTTVRWDAEIVQERENEWIAWRSLQGSTIENSGSVRFQPAPGARGTEVRVQLQYNPPAGQLGRAVAWMFGEEPKQQIHEDLKRFKQLMETGEIAISEGPGLLRAARPRGSAEDMKTYAGVRL